MTQSLKPSRRLWMCYLKAAHQTLFAQCCSAAHLLWFWTRAAAFDIAVGLWGIPGGWWAGKVACRLVSDRKVAVLAPWQLCFGVPGAEAAMHDRRYWLDIPPDDVMAKVDYMNAFINCLCRYTILEAVAEHPRGASALSATVKQIIEKSYYFN